MIPKGTKLSEEHKKKISEAMRGKRNSLGYKQTEKHKRNSILGRTGYKHSEKTKLKMRLASLGKKNHNYGKETPQTIIDKISASLKGRVISLQHRDNLSKALKGKKFTESHKKALKNKWASLNEEDRKNRLIPLLTANPSSLENVICDVLDELDIKYERQKHIHPYFVDIYIPIKNLIVECDGEYWHNKPGRKELDKKRDNFLISLGYKIIHLPGKKIKKNRDITRKYS